VPELTQAIDTSALTAALTGSHHVVFPNGTSVSVIPAIILDLDSRGIVTTRRGANNVRYDLDGDGFADATSWIGATEGFLFLDRDKSGTFNDIAELNFLSELAGATSNIAALRAFDTNNDRTISASDARFADFMIWQDRNGNGVADAGEILTLTAAGVQVINLATTATTTPGTADAVLPIARGTYQRTNGTTVDLIDGALTFRAISDGLARIDVAVQTYDRNAKKYRISTRDGQLSVTGKYVSKALDGRAGGLSGAFEITYRNATIGMLSAIVLDLDGNGVSLMGKGSGQAWFDMNGDGSPDEQGWTSRSDGFLVIDRNNNGLIDNASELSMLVEDPLAKSSMAALARLDSNGDKLLDAKDARFGELRIWVDANGNGITDAGELKTLTDLGIQSIGLDARNRSDSVRPGQNLLISTATYTMTNGMVRTVGDAALAFRPSQPDPSRVSALYTPNAPAPVVPAVEPAGVPLVEPMIGSAASQMASAMATFGISAATHTLLKASDAMVGDTTWVPFGMHEF
jgi:hypothetical protein